MESQAGVEVVPLDAIAAVTEPEAEQGNSAIEQPTCEQQEPCPANECYGEAQVDYQHEQAHMQYSAADSRACQAVAFPVHHHLGNDQQQTTGTPSHLQDLTFSGPPYVPKAKPYTRIDYSHSNTRLMKIAYDNQKLVERLTSISRQEPSWSHELTKTSPSNVASSAVNRRKAAMTIAQENHALYQRLVAIKPSKDISRETLESEHRKNEAYRYNCATFKAKSPTHTME